ncbi:F-box/kelch-repeat protein At5g42350-like [Chenopodium quinoa]|uniref:F-box/kelch-repeat protein At5g42350-like n=1 Tax=Chenopodium quinoa TaxID=63459 RepID=UPI000B76BC81|nr:F-box/kelch-repeat protein At5g42350-like [Chenopodium quinoa]
MTADRDIVEDGLCQDLESLSVSRKLVRSVSQKLRKKRIHRSAGDEEETANGFSLRCLTLYGRGGGCKVGADTSEEFGDSSNRRRSSASEEGKGFKPICGAEETGVDCFSYGRKDRFWKRSNRKELEYEGSNRNSRINLSLPDDILEMCLMRLPLSSLMNARLVCKRWNNLTTTPRFMQMRSEGLYQTPWLFVFGAVKEGYCTGEIHVLDVSLNQWHNINAEVLRGRFMYSVASMRDEIFIVGGCSSLTSFGRVDRSSFKTHKSMLVFSPSTKSWRKVASMKYARSSPILGISEVSLDCPVVHSQSNRQDRRFPRSRLGGVSDVYEDPHRLSVRRQLRNLSDENAGFLAPMKKQCRPLRHRSETSSLRESKRFVLIAIGGLGSWDEPLDSGELYDSVSNKWIEIPKLPVDFGIVCSGVVCNGTFFVYSESDKLAGYDVERGFWTVVQTTPSPPRVHEYYPKLVSCNSRLFMLSVSWCEGDGQIGRRNKAIRKMWELDLMYLAWIEVSVHPDAPMDWNAAFVADKNLIFGVEMFKIFGQVLDFFTICNVSDKVMKWSHISRNRVALELDASSCVTKTIMAIHL